MKNRKGFTTVELVIVIAVIAILAAVLIPTFSGLITKANNSAIVQEARNLYTNYVTAVDYAAGETADETAVIKVVKGEDTFYVQVLKGSVQNAVSKTQPALAAGKPIIEADDTAESGVKWEPNPCAAGAAFTDTNEDDKCDVCGCAEDKHSKG